MANSETKKLSEVFSESTYRIPNYQRGYSWDTDQLEDLWEDLNSLSPDRTHYTGVLTLVERKPQENSIDYWLEKQCKNYYVVDGQQRLTTLVILILALLNEISNRKESNSNETGEINGRAIDYYKEKYLYVERKDGDHTRSYFLSYEYNNDNSDYLRERIFRDPKVFYRGDKNYYTRKLSHALVFFYKKLVIMDTDALKLLFDKVTNGLVFSKYVIENIDDQFVAFETINNRGKELSTLELLKNRLMYISTLLRNDGSTSAEQKKRQDDINDVWYEVYRQLGRRVNLKLEDEDFLKDHWITRFPYTRKKGDDYKTFLLKTKFATSRALGINVTPNPITTDDEEPQDDSDSNTDTFKEENIYNKNREPIEYKEIWEYVFSLRLFAEPWFYSSYPEADPNMDIEERSWINKLNYIGIEYFRPLVAVILKRRECTELHDRISVYRAIERFIFIAFRLCRENKNYLDSEFYRIARKFDLEQSENNILVDLHFIERKLNAETEVFLPGGILKHEDYLKYIRKLFQSGKQDGFYGWHGLRYFLLVYEMNHPQKGRRADRIDIDKVYHNMANNKKGMLSIEHIYPQEPKKQYWQDRFGRLSTSDQLNYQGSLGNLLLLSQAINASLQNDGFDEKVKSKDDEKTGIRLRNGYADGSYSEMEVANYGEWTPKQIYDRGMKLLEFMERNWKFKFQNLQVKQDLLNIPSS
jgi:uncharacterized protein with ParB-like and HNH nuclease domain